jgi:RNA ligase
VSEISSYGKVYACGNQWVSGVFIGPVVVQEKVDGSQFSFCVDNGELHCRSRNVAMTDQVYEKMFAPVVHAVSSIIELLNPRYIYRGEFLASPKHHAVKYVETPPLYVILFDIEMKDSPQTFLTPEQVREEADLLGLLAVPTYYEGNVPNAEFLLPFLNNTPILGGEFIEGIVIKNYGVPGTDGKIMKAKLVRDDFKEIQGKEWRKMNPTGKDVAAEIADALCTPARWNKAIQHLEEDGKLTNSPQDIGELLKAINADILEEETENIKEVLFKHYWRQISKGATRGFPEWYKRKLMGLEDATLPEGDNEVTSG